MTNRQAQSPLSTTKRNNPLAFLFLIGIVTSFIFTLNRSKQEEDTSELISPNEGTMNVGLQINALGGRLLASLNKQVGQDDG